MIRFRHRSTLRPSPGWFLLLASAILASSVGRCDEPLGIPSSEVDAELRAMVEADWTAQERRRDRNPHDPEAARDALSAAERLADAMRDMPDAPDLRAESDSLRRIARDMADLESLDESARLALYRRIRWTTRAMALKNPLLAGRPILFMKRRRFICQMLHEYIGYYYNYDGLHGGGVFALTDPGRSLDTRDLIAGRMPRGNYATPALSHDGKTIYFAFVKLDDIARDHPSRGHNVGMPAAVDVPETMNYYGPNRRCFDVYAMDGDGRRLRRLTDGREDDFNPCPLPDGRVIFMSSRRGGFCRCDNPFEPIPTTTLHVMNADGRAMRTLSFHETNEWHPSVLNDGRIVYCRWDYVDRSAAHFHGLWAANPDGSNPVVLFGNYTKRVSACFQPRAIPGSNRICFVAGAHHADVGGSLVLFDPSRAMLDNATGEDLFDSLERLTPEVGFPETPGIWPGSYFHSPSPLSEDFFLTAFSFEPLPGMGSGELRDTQTGLYYFDRFGNMELLYRDPDISSMHPIPLAPQYRPPAIASVLDPELGDEGEFLLGDIGWSLMPLPAKRRPTSLRVFQVLPKSETHIANRPRIGYANAESARLLLGSVPIETDGSGYFRAPAGKPLYFQAVDADGRAVQSMRSLTYLQPGERRGCVGCHERPGSAPPRRRTIAMLREPSTLTPGPDGSRPMSFPRLVQPVLDAHCVRCHDGEAGPGRSRLTLSGAPSGEFSESYANLRPYVRWYEWGGETIAPNVTPPGQIGADASPLTGILDDATHRSAMNLPDAARRRIYLWLDANAPFYGVYASDAQRAQREGKAVAVPELQ